MEEINSPVQSKIEFVDEMPTLLSDFISALPEARKHGLDGLAVTPNTIHLDLDDATIEILGEVVRAIPIARSQARWVSILVMLFPIFKRIYLATREKSLPTIALK